MDTYQQTSILHKKLMKLTRLQLCARLFNLPEDAFITYNPARPELWRAASTSNSDLAYKIIWKEAKK